MNHRQIYNKAKKIARQHFEICALLGNLEQEKYGFGFADTDSDEIIDTINYGYCNLDFDNYKKEMEFYKKSFDENNTDLKGNGIYCALPKPPEGES